MDAYELMDAIAYSDKHGDTACAYIYTLLLDNLYSNNTCYDYDE